MKTSSGADSQDKAAVAVLRKQIQALPEALKEQARAHYLMNEDIKMRDLQDFQMHMISKIEFLLKKRLVEEGLDYRKFRIGGHERGVYERFYRIEPGKYMSKPQFCTALYRCFGDELKKSEKSLHKLYDSFDQRKLGEMDWRAVLLLLLLAMQPELPVTTYFHWAYALYASSGSYDLNGRDPITFEAIKSIVCVPVQLARKQDVRELIDDAWLELVLKDYDVSCLVRDKLGPGGTDAIPITFSLMDKILKNTSFAELMAPYVSFGTKDTRTWTYAIEERYYHPVILERMKILRREDRNEDECRLFIKKIVKRTKKKCLGTWRRYVRRRERIRFLIVQASVKWRNDQIGRFYDHWKQLTIWEACATSISTFVKGFIGRRRAKFMKRLQKRVVQVQANYRGYFRKNEYYMKQHRRTWAATSLQRNFRGWWCRKRVKTMVEEIYDMGMRNVKKERIEFYIKQREDSAKMIQKRFRKWRFAKKVKDRVRTKLQTEFANYEMDMRLKQNAVDTEVYRESLVAWFQQRRAEYEVTLSLEDQDIDVKRKIFAFRNRQRIADAEEKKLHKEALFEKEEENRVELWLKKFEEKKKTRTRDIEAKCRRCLLMSETPDELDLKKFILDKQPKQVKAVLRRADKQKIPLEIPEAREIAIEEIIQQIVADELAKVIQEGRDEAEEYQRQKEEKEEAAKQKLARERKLKRKWAAITIQGLCRYFLARKLLRKKAYSRYEKLFDPASFSYYYCNKRTKRSVWKKPLSLGTYDVDAFDGWMVLVDDRLDNYYYNTLSWQMQYHQPTGTMMCDACSAQFAILRFQATKRVMCEACANEEVKVMLSNGMEMTDITFRQFDGHSSRAMMMNINNQKLQNWQAFLMKADPTISEETVGPRKKTKDEKEFKRQRKLAALRAKMGAGKKSEDSADDVTAAEGDEDEDKAAPLLAQSKVGLGLQSFLMHIEEDNEEPTELTVAAKMEKIESLNKYKGMSPEEKVAEKKRKHAEKLAAAAEPTNDEEDEENVIVVDFCSKCKAAPSRMQCNMCCTYFCEKCFKLNHRKAPWNAHSFIEVNKHLKAVEEAEKAAEEAKEATKAARIARKGSAETDSPGGRLSPLTFDGSGSPKSTSPKKIGKVVLDFPEEPKLQKKASRISINASLGSPASAADNRGFL